MSLIWFLLGWYLGGVFLTITFMFCLALFSQDSNAKNAFCEILLNEEDIINFLKIGLMGPFVLIPIIIALIYIYLDIKEEKERRRKNASWWELKKFGGKL